MNNDLRPPSRLNLLRELAVGVDMIGAPAALVRARARSKALGRPVTLIGWSLGGYVAREVARDLPEEVEAVITMGSPVIGGPKYTATAPLFRRRGLDLDRMEGEIGKRSKVPLTQPVTAIYSKSDGIVGWQAAIDHESENIRHVEVNVSHMGLGVNAKVWGIVQAALEARG